MGYRPDIDGLRALAVAAVILFHIGVDDLPGGFIGVDVFFVISGYLITRLIVEHLHERRFSFWDFYARRTRRIFPALFVMILAVLVMGYFVLTPGEYADLGKSAVFSSAFLANVYFWLNTGYFDALAETMPLLHIWSIGVEEQFYVIWPLTLVLLWHHSRLGKKATLTATAIATALLAILCIVWTAYDSKSAFYLPFTRLWEFTLGAGMLAIPTLKARLAHPLSILGLIAIGYAAVTFTAELPYPGAYAILPCLGTAALIATGKSGVANRALSVWPAVFLGKISYSLYLWHWPVIVFYAHITGDRPHSAAEQAVIVVAAMAIATTSWYFVEQPARRRREQPRLHVLYGAMAAASVACFSFLIAASQGFPGRLPPEVRALSNYKQMTALRCPERLQLLGNRDCVFGAPWVKASRHGVLWGDSHARHLVPFLDIAARELDLSVVLWRGCPPFIDNDNLQRNHPKRRDYSAGCASRRKHLLAWLSQTRGIDLVIIANAWSIYPSELIDGSMKDANVKEVLIKIQRGIADTIDSMGPDRPAVLLVGDAPRPGFHGPELRHRETCRSLAQGSVQREP